MYEYYIDLAYATMIDGSFRPCALGTAAAGTGFGVFADAATAGVMSRFDEYDEADISGGAENTREVVLYSDTSIGALRVFTLDWSSGYIEPSEGETVFEKGGLWPARPIVLTVPNESMTPLFGFAFEAATQSTAITSTPAAAVTCTSRRFGAGRMSVTSSPSTPASASRQITRRRSSLSNMSAG